MSGYLTQRLADNTIDLVREPIEQALEQFGRSQLYITVIDRNAGAMITERSIGTPDEKMSRYAELALKKALLSVRTNLSSREVLAMHRGLLRPVIRNSTAVSFTTTSLWAAQVQCSGGTTHSPRGFSRAYSVSSTKKPRTN